MLITGELFYDNDLNKKESFVYNGELMQKISTEFYSCDLIDKFEFNDTAFKLNWNNGDLEKFLSTCNDLNIMVDCTSIEFTKNEKQLGIDYIYNKYPVTSEYCDINQSTIMDYLPYDFCGTDLYDLTTQVNDYLNGKNSHFYHYIEWILEYQIQDELVYWQETYGDTAVLEYVKDCFDNCLKDYPNDVPEFIRILENYEEFKEFYLNDTTRIDKLYNDYQAKRFNLFNYYKLTKFEKNF